ncbi:MAG: hypothetical protein EPO12_15510 [Aquabacterium sp.]|nr:MAG: hypothetical protein EPO12_15510 [Aquabacterium sp.]
MKRTRILAVAAWLSAAAASTVCCPAARGAQAEGLNLPDAVEADGRRLLLTASGLGMRALVFKVYVVALYLQERKASPAEMLAAPGPRRLAVALLRDVDGESFRQGLQEALDEQAGLGRWRGQLAGLLAGIPFQRTGLRRGDVLAIDWRPDEGLVVSLNQNRCLGLRGGVELFNALLRVWLDEDPARSVLKSAEAPIAARAAAPVVLASVQNNPSCLTKD